MIAPLASDAVPAAVALWHAAGLTRPWNDAHADARRALAGATSTIFAADVDGRLAGTVMVGHDGHRGWVYYLAVADECRRTGIGRALMLAAMDWLRAAGVPRLNLMVRDGNAAVLGFYAALGFRRAEVQVLQHDL
jgi:ribosomal protein S18 acetylase RimI-like enzyme